MKQQTNTERDALMAALMVAKRYTDAARADMVRKLDAYADSAAEGTQQEATQRFCESPDYQLVMADCDVIDAAMHEATRKPL